MRKYINKNNGGYAILELLFYISFYILLSLVVINAMITMSQSFRETEVKGAFLLSGNIMERISSEIRQAESINLISGNSLKLNTKDQVGSAKTVEFALEGSNAVMRENEVLLGNLNASDIRVVDLSFVGITTEKGAGVKIILTVQSINDKYARSVNFYNTAVLRENY